MIQRRVVVISLLLAIALTPVSIAETTGARKSGKNIAVVDVDAGQVVASVRDHGEFTMDVPAEVHLHGNWLLPKGTISIHAQGGIVADDWQLSSPGSSITLGGSAVRLIGHTRLSVAQRQGNGGSVSLRSDTGVVEIARSASIDASGGSKGGHILIAGHDVQSRGDLSALGRGLIEVEARNGFQFLSHVETGGGLLRLDPSNLTITNGSDANLDGTSTTSNVFPTPMTTANIQASGLMATLNGGTSVVIHTTNEAGGPGTGLQFGITGDHTDGDISVETDVTWTTAANLTLQANDDLIVLAKVQCQGSGKVIGVSGWGNNEPAATFAGTSAPAGSYGLAGGDTFLRGGSNVNAAFGSRDGLTAIWASRLILQGSLDPDRTKDGYAMVGFNLSDGSTASGAIQVNTTSDISLLGGSGTSVNPPSNLRWAQIGHGGGLITGRTGLSQGNLSGAIDVNTTQGAIVLDDGDLLSYAQIGHGGFLFDHVSRSNMAGNIHVTSKGLTIKNESGTGANAQIGHGGFIDKVTTEGTMDGSITVDAGTGDILMITGESGLVGGAKIGHGSSGVTDLITKTNVTVGNIGSVAASPITVNAKNINLTNVLTNSKTGVSQIGHGGQIIFGGTFGTIAGNITVTATGNINVAATEIDVPTQTLGDGGNCNNYCGSQIGHSALQGTVFASSVGLITGTISVHADSGTITLKGGGLVSSSGQAEFAQIGHGGPLFASQEAFGGSTVCPPPAANPCRTNWAGANGDVSVFAQSVAVRGGKGFAAYAQIGNGGLLLADENNFSHINVSGTIAGDVSVKATSGDLTVVAGSGGGQTPPLPALPYRPSSYAQIGNGGQNGSNSAVDNAHVIETGASGSVTITIKNESSLMDGAALSQWWLGHRTRGSLTGAGPVMFDTGTLDFLDGGAAATNATINDPKFWKRYVGDSTGATPEKANAVGGDVTLRVHGLSDTNGDLISSEDLTIPTGITNLVHVVATRHMTIDNPVAAPGGSSTCFVDLVSDDAFPTAPGVGPGILTLNATPSGHVRMYTVQPSQFVDGVSFNPSSQYGIYYPSASAIVGINYKIGADVSIDKNLVTPGPYVHGQSITYTLKVSNNGPMAATNIQVTDTPTNLAITSVTGGGCAALPCTIPTLASGANTTITVTATISAPGTFDNSATVTATEPEPDSSNNTDNTGNSGTAAASADVSIVKTLTTAGPFVHGQSITYTLFVANAGPSTATNIQVTDTPSNLSITNVSGGGCAALPCTIASLASGANTTITVTATISAPGAFDNSATVSATESDPVPGNNTDNTGNGGTASASADVSIVKTLTTAGPFVHGQSITYTLFVANGGPSTATNIQVTDTPTNLSITNVSGGGCAALPCTIASLASGANTTITVTATISAPGAFDNSATVSATESDPNIANNTDNTGNGGTAAASADVSIVKTLTTAGPFVHGQSISYSLLVANAGPSTGTNVQVSDTPTNLSITGVSGGGCAALPCTIASLASGANVTITVTATISAPGAFDNSATVSATESDPNSANNTDNTGNGGTAAASADVSIVKTLTTAGPYVHAQSISYSLLVANAGPSTATNIQVSDTPSNLSITGVSGGGCAALPCTIASLASGANVTITVTATITAPGAFDNSATVSATESDPVPGNNTDNTGNGGTAAASADVSMVKTLTTAGPYTHGQSISYTLFVANAGPSTATNIQVTDTPSSLTITNVSGGGCAALPCTIASLASGANTTITVTATISAPGAFDNSATATATQSDPVPGNNTDNTGNGGTAAASADVSMVKTLTTAGPYVIGQSITYTLVAANAGPSTATSIQVTDTPTNLSITNVTGSGCAALPCTIASIASGANTTITVTATITAVGAFDNSATATATEGDPNSANNTDNTGNGGTAAPAADVSMVKTLATAGPFTVGQTVSYTLAVANAGPSTATSIQVTDTPTNLTITNVSGSGCAALPCTIASLASGANTTITVTATITAFGAFDNSATATAAETDPNPANNTDNTGNGGSTLIADVSLAKTLVTSGPFVAGQTISYTLAVANGGPSTATSIQVTDAPTNLTITGVSGSGCAALPCTIASIASGSNTTITVTATINAAGAFDNSATATATEFDPNLADNTDAAGNGGAAAASADISLVKTLTTAGPFVIGQTVNYTLVVANAGPSPATNIQVTDTPTNLTITNVSGSGCAALPCTIASLASGANTTINVTATITTNGAFDNSATATGAEFDPNSSNNTDSTGNGGAAGATADVSLIKTLVTAGPFYIAQSVSYTLVVSNAGPSTATSIQVTDTPTNLTITTVSGSGCAALPCTIASLAAGANTTINVTATINAVGAFDNSATATAAEIDGNNANNTDNTGNGGNALASADVSIVKTLLTPAPYVVGQNVNYTLVVSNAGPSTATNISVADAPTNLTITSVSGSGCAALPCTIASLASGANTTINVTATIPATGAFDNSASATAAEFDPNSAGNTDNTGNGGFAFAAAADVSLVKTLLTTGTFTSGHTINYTIVVSNAGPSTATNIQVTDTPTNLTITSVSGRGCAALP